jgi:hypothetical protein
MDRRIALATGAYHGIGFEVCRQLARRVSKVQTSKSRLYYQHWRRFTSMGSSPNFEWLF